MDICFTNHFIVQESVPQQQHTLYFLTSKPSHKDNFQIIATYICPTISHGWNKVWPSQLLRSTRQMTFSTFSTFFLFSLISGGHLHYFWVAVFFYKVHATISAADLYGKQGALIVNEQLPQKLQNKWDWEIIRLCSDLHIQLIGLIALSSRVHVDCTVSLKTRNWKKKTQNISLLWKLIFISKKILSVG